MYELMAVLPTSVNASELLDLSVTEEIVADQ